MYKQIAKIEALTLIVCGVLYFVYQRLATGVASDMNFIGNFIYYFARNLYLVFGYGIFILLLPKLLQLIRVKISSQANLAIKILIVQIVLFIIFYILDMVVLKELTTWDFKFLTPESSFGDTAWARLPRPWWQEVLLEITMRCVPLAYIAGTGIIANIIAFFFTTDKQPKT